MYKFAKVIVVLALLTLLSACNQPVARVDIQMLTPVEVEEVELRNVESLIETTGTIKTRASATVNSRIPGRLYIGRDSNGKRFEEGDDVEAGTVIGQLTGIETTLHVGLDSALRALENAQIELEGAEALFCSKYDFRIRTEKSQNCFRECSIGLRSGKTQR